MQVKVVVGRHRAAAPTGPAERGLSSGRRVRHTPHSLGPAPRGLAQEGRKIGSEMSRPLAVISLRNLSRLLFRLAKMRAWTVLLLPAVARAARCAELPDGQMLPGFDGGDDEDARAEWLSELQAVRAACQEDFDATIYERADLAWTRTSYIQTQMHPFDRTFYERGVGYTPSRFLDDLRARYGGVDALLLWPTYPNIGHSSSASTPP